MATIWYSTEYYVDIDVLRRYLFLLIKFDNLLFRLLHTFGCKQTISKMLKDSSAFATLGDAHGELSVMVAIDRSTVYGTPFNSFWNGFHHIRSMSHMFGWPYVIPIW